MMFLMGLVTALAFVPLVWIVTYVMAKGGRYLNPAFFTQLPKPMGVEGGGILHAIEGTLLLVGLATLFAIPIGVLAAFYVAEHSNASLAIAVRFGTDVLAGVPSIVIGLFCYTVVVKSQGHFSALAGGVALAIIMLPTIVRTTEEMLKLVPRSLREASLGLGAPEWKTSLKVLMPAAIEGIITGFLLAMARAAGETAPLLFTALGNDRYEISKIIRQGIAAGMSAGQIISGVIGQPVDALPLTLWKYAQQPYPERIAQSWAVALVLMTFVLSVNVFVRIWIQRRMSRLKG
ncbi:MAG: phosphate ABC transporter permease PstA [Chloroflexi bacterium]|nr:phosphate ABC transporter permease PstA [Chloroflexota bacterium]